LAWCNTPRTKGGLGPMDITIVEDLKKTISKDYGVLCEDEGVAFRYLFFKKTFL